MPEFASKQFFALGPKFYRPGDIIPAEEVATIPAERVDLLVEPVIEQQAPPTVAEVLSEGDGNHAPEPAAEPEQEPEPEAPQPGAISDVALEMLMSQSVEDILATVEGDPELAKAVLDVEMAGDNPRSTLLKGLGA